MELIEILITLPIWVDLGLSLFIFLFFLLLRKLFTRYVFTFILKVARKSPTDYVVHFFEAFEKSIRWFFVLLGLYLAIVYLPFEHKYDELILQIYRTLLIILITSGFYRLASSSTLLLSKVGQKFDLEIETILIPLLSKILRFFIVAVSLSVIAQEWNYDINAFVAGLGLGGLAIAFAAQELIEDFFGGFIILTEKPFTVGDWIRTSNLEGTVEEINFRSTKLRVFRQAVVTVPNSSLVNEAITNWTKMGKRQITFQLQLKLDTPRWKIEKLVSEIETFLKNNNDIHQETIFVTFDSIDQKGYNIFLYFFTKTTVWEEYLQVKEAINYKILEIVKQENISIAFPSRSLYIENVLKK